MKRTAILTGASRGIGRATACALASIDCDLILVSRRQDELERLAAELNGVKVTVAPVNLVDSDECEGLSVLSEALTHDSYPILINAAGAAQFASYADSSVGSILEQIDTNLRGPAVLCRYVLPWMMARGGGQIINVLSMAATHTLAGAAAYSASKAGMLALGRGIAAECRSQGIRVTALLPGAVDTPIWDTQSFNPPREDMLPATAVAEVIRDLVAMPLDRNVDELLLMPQKGIL